MGTHTHTQAQSRGEGLHFTMATEDRMLFGVPKKGRLHERCLKLLDGAGIRFVRVDRLDLAPSVNMPLSLVFLPAADIAKYVGESNVDMGITGQDMIEEAEVSVETVTPLGFGKCKLAVQTPVANKVTDVKTLAGGRIVTSFPSVTKAYFSKIVPDNMPSIKYVSGSVEVACSLGLADAVVDLVETGTTMKAAGLEIADEILKTEAVLIANPRTKHPELVKKIGTRVNGYLSALKYEMITYNIPRAKLPEAKAITPGKKAPTISPLEETDWVAVSSLISKSDASEVMDKLQDLGATDI